MHADYDEEIKDEIYMVILHNRDHVFGLCR
jgi:predicted Zn-dependent protease with MMP-like domain